MAKKDDERKVVKECYLDDVHSIINNMTVSEFVLRLEGATEDILSKGHSLVGELFFEVDYYYEETSLSLMYNRWETDEEYEKRMEINRKATAAKAAKKRKEKEAAIAEATRLKADRKALYQELKKEFGDG